MNYFSKKRTNFLKIPINENNPIKKHQNFFIKKNINLENYIQNKDNNICHIHYPTGYFNEYPFTSVDTYSNNYLNYKKIKPKSNSTFKEDSQSKILSYSQDKRYFNKEDISSQKHFHTPKSLFMSSDLLYNDYNFSNIYLNTNVENNYSYNNYYINPNFKTNINYNYVINTDNISNDRNIINYNNINNSISFNFLRNDKIKGIYNSCIFNTNDNYEYDTIFSKFNTLNNDYRSYNNYINTGNDNNNKYNSKINKNYSYFQKHLSNNHNMYNNNKFHFCSQKNIRNDYLAETKKKLKRNSKLNLLKDQILYKLDKNKYKLSKYQKRNNSISDLKKKNENIINRNEGNYTNHSIKELKQKDPLTDRKNKSNIDEKFNKISNTREILKRYKEKNNLKNLEIIKNSNNHNYYSIKKENPNFINKTILKNGNLLSRNNYKRKGNLLKMEHKSSSAQNKVNINKSMNNCITVKITFSKNKNKDDKNINSIIKNDNFLTKKDLNSKKIFNNIKIINSKNKNIRINSKLNNINIMKNTKRDKKETNKKVLTFRKHICKIILSKMTKECELCHKLIVSHLFQIHYNSHPTQILNWLYLGTFSSACDIQELKRNKIYYILNCAIECNNTKLTEEFEELHLNIKDTEDFEIIEYFDEANDFINKCRLGGGNILVHCKFGISRSPSFIIAYLIKYNSFNLEEALSFVIKKRKQIKPNKGFMNQLHKYQKSLGL